MNIKGCAVLLLLALSACSTKQEQARVYIGQQCSATNYQLIADKVQSDDDLGHGPDIASDEWKSVIEYKLGIRDKPTTPEHTSQQWCSYILDIIEKKSLEKRQVDVINDNHVAKMTPSFDCANTQLGSAEDLVCSHQVLASLDSQLSAIYQQAKYSLTKAQINRLRATQHGWRKGRDDCWKAQDQTQCIEQIYMMRIATLQAKYDLVPSIGPVTYSCNNEVEEEINLTFYQTNPATVIAERGNNMSLMFQKPSASGARYQGRNESLWEHQGEARITWGYNAKPMTCEKKS
ncbi:MliC family protein [Thalassotalea sediminis]|uniref:MliC family protein n=1 Tax=Thalassotalea sediminis TaxID=1759089 RepID=UPI002573F424|nr:MliC family protein [Thalassotalea sediminis]